MSFDELAAVAAGKTILSLTQTLKLGGGSAAPGLYALKISPRLIGNLCRLVPKTVVITGTNGKTTTARMLTHFAESQGMKVLRNKTGSNLERGVASALVSSFRLNELMRNGETGPGTYDMAIWELDEAAFNRVVPQIKPDLVIFLNVFRDQLDRYGEVDTVVKKWCRTLKDLDPHATILINGDDSNLLQLQSCFRGKTKTFGLANYKIAGEKVTEGRQKTKFDFEAEGIKTKGLEQTSFAVTGKKFRLPVKLPLPGIYHIYNFLAAFAALFELEMPVKPAVKQLGNFSPAFGRVEKLQFKSGGKTREGYIFLIKNPAGATQIFQTIKDELQPSDRLLLALNDKLADGTDVSWIWDGQFEQLINPSLRAAAKQSLSPKKIATATPWLRNDKQVIISGTRAADLALRLKYAGFKQENLIVQQDLKTAFAQAKKGLQGRLFILPTYTCLLELQKILARSGVKRPYWEE